MTTKPAPEGRGAVIKDAKPEPLTAEREAALEEAAAGYDARADECCRDAGACDAAGDADNAEFSRSLASHHSLTAAELRALAEKQP